jgi:hypothetical protein
VILSPIGAAIGLFVFAAIAHLLVMLFVGGANSGYEATLRVVCYVSVTSLVNWIPVIGGLPCPLRALPGGCGHEGGSRHDDRQGSAGRAAADRRDSPVGAHRGDSGRQAGEMEGRAWPI